MVGLVRSSRFLRRTGAGSRLRFTRVMTLVGLLAAIPTATTSALPAITLTPVVDIVPGMHGSQIVAPRGFFAALERAQAAHASGVGSAVIPSFSRQTKLACSACHYAFPALTPFGRRFKLNGYTLTGLATIGEPTDTSGGLKLAPFPPASAMIVASVTRTNTAQPATQNNTTSFPQQASIFFSGQVTSNLGAFTQFTYTANDGKIGIDNVDVRYARHATMGDRDVLIGVTLHNNPTVQDVWNTTPAWGYPFMASSVAPSPAAATLIDGALAQQVVGLGVYSLFDNLLYAEATVYRSAPQGSAMPLDSSATNVTNGVAPYWRLALQHQAGPTYMMIGTYGFGANLYPQGVIGKTNRYTDVGADAQVEHSMGTTVVIGRATYIHERQHLAAAFTQAPQGAESLEPALSTVRANVGFLANQRYGGTVGFFQTTGTRDTLLFTPSVLTGSRTGSPNSAGESVELTYNAWENTRFGLQYVRYSKFNGASTAYDVSGGRSASDNNTLYMYTWLAF
ncbi:MAG: cytochrome C [Gemmatimonadaceae bacterium]